MEAFEMDHCSFYSKRLEPICQLKDCMRRMVWQEAIEDVVRHSHENHVIRRLEKLLAV